MARDLGSGTRKHRIETRPYCWILELRPVTVQLPGHDHVPPGRDHWFGQSAVYSTKIDAEKQATLAEALHIRSYPTLVLAGSTARLSAPSKATSMPDD